MKTYAGIGSRETPDDILKVMTQLARDLDVAGYTLRSGSANGADTAFEAGASKKEIYLPWARFNGSHSPLHTITPDALWLAAQFHPAWHRLSAPARKLMARNCHQVLGPQLNDPVKFVVCWTFRGNLIGGTSQALRIANFHKIPVFNLGKDLQKNLMAIKLIAGIDF